MAHMYHYIANCQYPAKTIVFFNTLSSGSSHTSEYSPFLSLCLVTTVCSMYTQRENVQFQQDLDSYNAPETDYTAKIQVEIIEANTTCLNVC